MRILPMSLSVVIKHFPEHRKTLEGLFQQHETFRSLCEDFCDSVRAREYWCGSEAESAKSRCQEYDDIIGDLTTEITQWLREHGAGS
jgi:myo-inositol catabolism protein IolC